MANRTLVLFSPLTPEECVERLRGQVAPDRKIFPFLSPRPLLGEVRSDKLRLKRNLGVMGARQVFYEFDGTMKAVESQRYSGALIQGAFGMDRESKTFLGLSSVFLILLTIIGTYRIGLSLGFDSDPTNDELLAFFIPICLLLFVHGLTWLMLAIRKSDIPYLTAFLMDTLQAKRPPTVPSSTPSGP